MSGWSRRQLRSPLLPPGRILLAVVVLAAAGAGVTRWRHWWPFHAAPQAAGPPPPVPVTLAKVASQPVPIAPILVMSLTSATLPLTQVNDYADNTLAQQLSQIDGVGLVQLSGTQKPAVRIQIDPARLSSLGLGLEDVHASVAAATANAPKGTFDGQSQSFTVYDNDQILAAAPWNDVIVAYRGGAPIRVRDIGTAVDGPENTKLAAWAYTDARTADGPAPRAIVLAVSKLPGANVIETVDRVKAALPRLQGAIPPSVEVSILTDRTQTIRASVADVQFTLMLTIALVVMVIFVFLRNLAAAAIPSLTVFLFIAIPEGFFPQQDTGFLFGQAVGPEDSSSTQMAGRMTALGEVIKGDSDVSRLACNVDVTSFNQGNFYVNLRPQADGRTATADEVIARLRPKAAQVPGVTLFLQALQDIRVGGRLSRTQYQYTLTSPELADLQTWAPRILDRMRGITQLTDVTSDQQTSAPAAALAIDRDQAARFGIRPTLIDATIYDAIGQRKVAQYFTQLNSYHVILEALPSLQGDPALLDQLRLASPVTGGQVPLSLLVRQDTSHTNALNISHQSQVPAVADKADEHRGQAHRKRWRAGQLDIGAEQQNKGRYQQLASSHAQRWPRW